MNGYYTLSATIKPGKTLTRLDPYLSRLVISKYNHNRCCTGGDAAAIKEEWLLCPTCKGKTRTRIRLDTTLTNFPLFCHKCKQTTLVNVVKLALTVIRKLDVPA